MTKAEICAHCETDPALLRWMREDYWCPSCEASRPNKAPDRPAYGKGSIPGIFLHHYSVQERGLQMQNDINGLIQKADLERALEALHSSRSLTDLDFNVGVAILINRRRQKDVAEELGKSRETCRRSQIKVIEKVQDWLNGNV